MPLSGIKTEMGNRQYNTLAGGIRQLDYPPHNQLSAGSKNPLSSDCKFHFAWSLGKSWYEETEPLCEAIQKAMSESPLGSWYLKLITYEDYSDFQAPLVFPL